MKGNRLLLLMVFSILVPGVAGGQVLGGRVIDVESGSPLPSASVKLIHLITGSTSSQLTNEGGLFQFPVDSEGPFVLDVFALGFLSYVDTLRVPAGEDAVSVDVRLGIDAIPLEGLVVTASRSPWWEVTEPRMVWDYHQRKDQHEKLGLGRFYDQDDLEMMFAAGPLSIFREIWPPRAEAASVSLMGRPCEYTYYIDGLIWNGTIDEIPYRTSDLYSIEIYRGPSEIPGEFLNSNTRCGVMVFWTWRSSRIG